MYLATGRLPHLLKPEAYASADFAAREAQALFRGAWHLVGTLDDIPRPGDFITCVVMGHALLVRNIEGEARTFSNVCAHRHFLLKAEARGHSPKLVCPYHGWRYDAKGRAMKVRDAANFHTPGGDHPALLRYRTALCGRLIFVAVDDDPPPLQAFLGDLYDLCAERFGDGWRPGLSHDAVFACNWKVQIENALESYHVPVIHKRTFGADPGEALTEHRLETRRTEFRADLVIRPRNPGPWLLHTVEAALMRLARLPLGRRYRHVHLYPNFTFAFHDTSATVQCLEPLTPTTSRLVLRQFVPRGASRSPGVRLLMRLWGSLVSRVAWRILQEDSAVYARIQTGLEFSRQPGLLGRAEERIHHFHEWILRRHSGTAADNS